MDPKGESEKDTIVSKFERNESWSPNKIICLYNYKGFWYPEDPTVRVIKAQDLKLSPSNTLLCSSLKTGTTWLKALAFAITSRTQFDPFSKDHPVLTSNPHDLIPYIEMLRHEPLEHPLQASHLPYTALPKSVSESQCKIVYICRNPKDVLVSLWHFMPNLNPKDKSKIPLDKALDLFCQGITLYGPYWDHVLEYWKASLEHPNTVLFLKYEDMMEDTEPHVAKLADFMGFPFSEEEKRRGVPTKIVDMCNFESLKNLEPNNSSILIDGKVVSSSIFFRKGKVGDWRNYLTDEMAAKLDNISMEKLGAFGLTLKS